MKAVQFRIARPTRQLDAISKFYTEGLGLTIIGEFKNHQGYDGIMIGLPDSRHHLEFTQSVHDTETMKPTKENLLVFYYDNTADYTEANNRLQQLNFFPVKPANPYWEGKSETYEDPDKWRIVIFNGIFK